MEKKLPGVFSAQKKDRATVVPLLGLADVYKIA